MTTNNVADFSRRYFLQQVLKGTIVLGSGMLLGEEQSVLAANVDFDEASSKKNFPRGYNLSLLTQYDRKNDSYTQGLVYEYDELLERGVLYESGGKYGRSLLRKVEADTGKILKQIKIPTQYFAEGIATIDNRLYMLTWRERACLVYDKGTFEQIDEFRYSGEGWGLTYDGKSLLMSDGSSRIRFLDPKTFRQQKSIDVHYMTESGKRRSVLYLNELEYIDGEIWANVYQQEYVVRIDPSSGLVLGSALNFSALTPKYLKSNTEYVLNGLAWDKKGQRLFVTGKCWPITYIFSLKPKRNNEILGSTGKN